MVFAISFTNKDKDEELVIYIRGVDNKADALERVENSIKYKTQFKGKFNSIHFAENLGIYDNLDQVEKSLFKGNLAFFDIESLT